MLAYEPLILPSWANLGLPARLETANVGSGIGVSHWENDSIISGYLKNNEMLGRRYRGLPSSRSKRVLFCHLPASGSLDYWLCAYLPPPPRVLVGVTSNIWGLVQCSLPVWVWASSLLEFRFFCLFCFLLQLSFLPYGQVPSFGFPPPLDTHCKLTPSWSMCFAPI